MPPRRVTARSIAVPVVDCRGFIVPTVITWDSAVQGITSHQFRQNTFLLVTRKSQPSRDLDDPLVAGSATPNKLAPRTTLHRKE